MKHLISLRLSKGLTKVDMGRVIGKTSNAYALYESDQREMPIKTLVQLAQFFNVTTDYILGLTSDEIKKEQSLSVKEKELLDLFRHMAPEKQERVIGISIAYADYSQSERRFEEASEA